MEQQYSGNDNPVSLFLEAYLTNRSLEGTLDCFHDKLIWAGAEMNEVFFSKEELSLHLVSKIRDLPNCIRYEINRTSTTDDGGEFIVVFSELTFKVFEGNSIILSLPSQITLAYSSENGKRLIRFINTTIDDMDGGADVVGTADGLQPAGRARIFQTILREKNYELESTYSSIPGGVLRVRMDSNFTLLYCNDTFLKMTGYTRQEIHSLFGDNVSMLIHEDDRKDTTSSLLVQLQSSRNAQLEYKLNTKGGEQVWVLEQGNLVTNLNGENEFFSVIVDISIDYRNRESLRISEERYRIILDQIDDILCEWDIASDTIEYSPNFEKMFGYTPASKNFSAGVSITRRVHPSDQRILRDYISYILKNSEPSAVEVRAQAITGRYIWVRIRASAVRNKNGSPRRVVGMITNINSQKLTLEDLRTKSQRDLLTGLYNKITAQEMVKEQLVTARSGISQALLIVDIDNFKLVNDSLGHMFGDSVLSDVAGKLMELFHGKDIIGRVGGDEFIVFLSNIRSYSSLKAKADDIADIFRNAYTKDDIAYKISCSIGIAIAPEQGTSFEELYRKSDIALYAAKNLGKDRYLIFSDDLLLESDEPFSAVGAIDSLLPTISTARRDDLSMLVFNELYESKNLSSTIDSVLGMIGEHVDVSRAYIFEISEDGLRASNTFEWCSDGISPCILDLQEIVLETFDGYFKNYNEAGIFCCNDVSKLNDNLNEFLGVQGIRSTLQVYITDGGKIRGFIGFDDCKRTRDWSKGEMDFIMHMSKMLGLFVTKRITAEEIAHSHKNQMAILNGMDAFTYVINPHDYSLLYINKKTMDLVPSTHLGATCYQSFWNNQEAPCKNCPMNGLSIDKSSNTLEIYNHTLGIWSEATASSLPWVGADNAVLVCCHDITRFKENKL